MRTRLPGRVEAGRRLGAQLRDGDGGLVALAITIGVGAGVGAIVFRWLVLAITRLFTGANDYSGLGRVPSPTFPRLGVYFVLITPVLGGLLYGPLVDRFAREARGHGVPEVMFAVSRRGGRIPWKVAGVKACASALCIGSGGSVGREGPIVQIGSALGSGLGQLFRAPESRLRTLVACGAAGGIAATFNAPIAGVFFALELLLGSFAVGAFAAVVLSAVTASVIGRAAFGDAPFLRLPAFTVPSPWAYLFFIVLGLLAALVGVGFMRVLYAVEDACDWAWRGPEWARPAAGGLLLGVVLLAVPEMYGVGYPVLENGVAGEYAIGFLLVLLAAKMLATSLTIGIGGSGGVFAPSLFCGAMLGSAFGQVVADVAPGLGGASGAYALVAMGCVFAAAARAPITAVLIMFELTGEYSIILPLMLAVVVSTVVANRLSRDTIYTLKLRRRGVDLQHAGQQRLGDSTVGDVMTRPPGILPAGLPLDEAARAILASGSLVLPVVDGDRVDGVVTATAVGTALAEDDDADRLTVSAVLHQPPPLSTTTLLADAADVLASHAEYGAPVLDESGGLVGWLDHTVLLRALSGSTRPQAHAPSVPHPEPAAP